MKDKSTDLLWDKLKDQKFEMFSLPNQKVSTYLMRLADIDGNLYLKIKNPNIAVVPFLEKIIKNEELILEQHNEYIIIKLAGN